jgi:hypothetical protein
MNPLADDLAAPRRRHAARLTQRRRAKRRRIRLVAIAVLGTALTAMIVAAGMVVGFHLTSRTSPTVAVPSTPHFSATLPNTPSAEAPAPAPAPPSNTGSLESDFAELQATLPATIGIALAPLGAPQTPLLMGDWSSGPAWSTIKVPLAIAALRGEDTQEVTDPMRAAITQSDNAAAEILWQGLGEPEIAAGKVDAVLQEVGDPTKVQSQRIRPEFSAFGQTIWSLADQTRFLAAAACDSRNEPILNLMGEIAGDQQWGLSSFTDARFKGGWGPSEAGSYLVRQIGVLPVDAGKVVVAIAVQPQSGAFGDGTAELTQIAEWLRGHAAALPAGQCQG